MSDPDECDDEGTISRSPSQRDRHEGEEEDQAATGAQDPESFSQASQVGRARQVGGTPAAGLEPGTEPREGWPIPDQSDTPPEWPLPSSDS